jgi:hypothetical protein
MTMVAMHVLSRTAAALVAAIFAAGLMVGAALAAASDFEGTWKTQDTKGQAFEIILSADGKAKGSRADEGLNGTWKVDGDSALITWDSGWTTKIVKEGDKFKKLAFEKGQSGAPTHTADAQKM